MSQTRIPVELRRDVRQRAQLRCEYCLVPEIVCVVSHEVDHVVAEKHLGATALENLALACSVCNKHKGTDLASIDQDSGSMIRLFNPRSDRWVDHFRLDGGLIVPVTPVGRVTVRLLRMNRGETVDARALMRSYGFDLVPDR